MNKNVESFRWKISSIKNFLKLNLKMLFQRMDEKFLLKATSSGIERIFRRKLFVIKKFQFFGLFLDRENKKNQND